MNHIAAIAEPPCRTRKKRGEGASRRGEILDAAKRLFVEEGFQNATMRRIAAVVGVSPTALYVYFSDKTAILQAIAEDMFAELLERLQQTQTDTGEPPLVRLRRGLRTYVEFGLSRPAEYRLTFQTHAAANLLACKKVEVADRSFAVLERGVEELIAGGIFMPRDPVMVAEAIWSALHGVTTVLLDCGDEVQTRRDELIDAVISMAIRGFVRPGVELA